MKLNNAPEPTLEMVAHFDRRTREHIARVRQCLKIVGESWRFSYYADVLEHRGSRHDASKFGDEERIGFTWITEFHRCRQAGIPFAYPAGVQELIPAAVDHHYSVNRHHPEFYSDFHHGTVDSMSVIDLIEMVCDWTAMAMELGESGGSARGWADKVVGSKYKFADDRKTVIYDVIGVLEKHFAE